MRYAVEALLGAARDTVRRMLRDGKHREAVSEGGNARQWRTIAVKKKRLSASNDFAPAEQVDDRQQNDCT